MSLGRRTVRLLAMVGVAASGCSGGHAPAAAPPPVEVNVLEVAPANAPVSFEFVGQTQSSQQVEIRARVNGFLEERVYTEGSKVHAGDVLFRMDKKPFEASLDAAKAELAQQRARLNTAQSDLNRVRPLAAKNALSQRDLDVAVGQQQSAAASLEQARANVTSAQLNLGYTDIKSPVDGVSSFAKKQVGSYIDSTSGLLTYVAKLDPMWVNFSLSENEFLQLREQTRSGAMTMPGRGLLNVEIVMADGGSFPTRGRIAFSDASLDNDTGTYLIRAEFPNPDGVLRPGQFVRVKVRGIERTRAFVVPQQAVMQGDRGAFVWTVGPDGHPQQRAVETGEWSGNNWVISSGLRAGDKIIVNNLVKMNPNAVIKPHAVGATQ